MLHKFFVYLFANAIFLIVRSQKKLTLIENSKINNSQMDMDLAINIYFSQYQQWRNLKPYFNLLKHLKR